jgi:hypothetical protein
MFSIEMAFKDGGSRFKLKWTVLETTSALLWMKLLLKAAQDENAFFPRFTGFISPRKTHENICAKLNRAIELINKELNYPIPERAQGPFTQEFANKVHHHFELLAGAIDQPSQYWVMATSSAKAAIASLNHCIHDLEALSRAHSALETKNTSARALVLEGIGVKRYKLPDLFNADFSLNNDYGDIVLHYAQIGKTWWEVFLDQDHEISNQAILPLNFITGEFDVFFESIRIQEGLKQNFDNFLSKRGVDPQDPGLRLGYITVGKLENSLGWSEEECDKMIATHELESIHILQDQKQMGSLRLDPRIYDLN